MRITLVYFNSKTYFKYVVTSTSLQWALPLSKVEIDQLLAEKGGDRKVDEEFIEWLEKEKSIRPLKFDRIDNW